MNAVLKVERISKHYRGVKAVDDVSFELEAGEVLGLIGPNGAGKTTLLNLITGYVRPDSGTMEVVGRGGGRPSVATWVSRGLTRTFQTPYLYEDVSVIENVRRAAYARHRQPILRQALTPSHSGDLFVRMQQESVQALDVVGLPSSVRDAPASSLPYGHRKLVGLAMVLATAPDVVCLDEPAAGLNRSEKDNVVGIVERLRASGKSIVLVEHDMGIVSAACARTLVLNYGRRIAEGKTSSVLEDPEVARAYLGGVTNG